MFFINKRIYRKRSINVAFLFCIIFVLLYIRIFNFQYVESNKLSVMADSQYSYKEDINELNYLLLDYKGRDLLKYNKKYYAVIIPNIFIKNNIDSNTEEILTLIYILRNYDEKYDLSKTINNGNSGEICYEVDKITYDKLKRLEGIKGFYTYFHTEIDRRAAWKIENLITNNKRTQDDSLKSKDSIEMKIYNKTKNNEKAQMIFNRDLNGNISLKDINIPKNNLNVRLTLDKDIQDKIKKRLNNSKYDKYNEIGVILVEAETGRIKAMLQKDDTYPNVNLGAYQGFYPGSIFKAIVEEAGIDTGKISLDEKFTCRGLYEAENHAKHGNLTPKEAFVISCNDVFAQIGNKVGFKNFYNNAKKQGMFSKVLNFDYEKTGGLEVDNPKYSDGTLGLAAIGQNLRITPIQSISIANTVANKGIYVKPHIVEGYVDDNNNMVEKIDMEQKSAINEITADIMKSQMKEVVEQGTGNLAYVEGVEVGGKTGTTERVEQSLENSQKFNKYSDGWFVGFFKYNNKYYSMVVFVQNIDKNTESAGTTACPIFSDIVKDILDK